MGMRKIASLLVTLAVSMTVAIAGCTSTPDKDVAKNNVIEKSKTVAVTEKPKTVMVNEGLSKKEEEKLNERLDELENKVASQGKKGSEGAASQPIEASQPEQSQAPPAEEQARTAAVAYYQAAAARNWEYTYEHLDSETQSAYTEQEWFAKNAYLADTGAVTYTIESVVMDPSAPETVANVTVVLTSTDGSTSVRNTYWVYEGRSWLHRFAPEEYDLLASAPMGSSSSSPSASASASVTSAQGNPYGCPDDRPIPATRAGDPGEGSLRCFATRSEANAYSQGN
jgi:predicted component of type VI protein secretion system